MTVPAPIGGFPRPVDGPLIRHFRGPVGENWCMQPVSDGAGGRARGKTGEWAHR